MQTIRNRLLKTKPRARRVSSSSNDTTATRDYTGERYVVFSDESRFYLKASDGHMSVHKRREKHLPSFCIH